MLAGKLSSPNSQQGYQQSHIKPVTALSVSAPKIFKTPLGSFSYAVCISFYLGSNPSTPRCSLWALPLDILGKDLGPAFFVTIFQVLEHFTLFCVKHSCLLFLLADPYLPWISFRSYHTCRIPSLLPLKACLKSLLQLGFCLLDFILRHTRDAFILLLSVPTSIFFMIPSLVPVVLKCPSCLEMLFFRHIQPGADSWYEKLQPSPTFLEL